MEWFSLVSTAVGVLLGVGATTFNEHVKWKRERSKARYDSSSKLYADYLADLTKTRDALRLVARGTLPPDRTLQEVTDAAFATVNIYARRYQIEITAASAVAAGASTALKALSEVRASIAAGQYRTYEYNAAFLNYENGLENLIAAMAADLIAIG